MITRWFPASLSSRLLALFLLTALAAVLLMGSLFSKGLGTQWRRAIVPHLFQYVEYIKDDLGTPIDETRARALAGRLPIQIQVYDASGNTMIFTTRPSPLQINNISFFEPRRKRSGERESPNNGRDSGRDTGRNSGHDTGRNSGHDTSQEHGRESSRGTSRTSRPNDISIGDDRRHPVVRVKTANNQIFIEFARPRSRDTGVVELLLAISGLALLLALCYFLIKRLLKPIGQLQSTVQKISDGDLSARTGATGNDDLAALAQSVDRMSERIQQMLDAKRELLLAISHELRSPLTRARIATELLDTSKHKQKIINDIDEMDSLIARLVDSERLQSHVVLDKKLWDVRKLVDDTVSTFDANIQTHHANATIKAHVDLTRLQVLLRNLLENALLHGQAADGKETIVSVHLSATDTMLQLLVTDNGAGLAEEHLSSVTEPFYRTDASRTRKTGGMGLGLYLSKRIAEAHGGLLTVDNKGEEQSGVCVTVKLPLNDTA